jgi:hypothetical protein
MLDRIPYRIDVLTGISGVSFTVAWRNRVTMATDIGNIPVLGLDDLRANKRAAGRPKDMLDLALLDELALAKPSRRRRTRTGGKPKSEPNAKDRSERKRRSPQR